MKTNIFVILLILLLFADSEAADRALPDYELSVSFDIENNLLKGNAKIILPPGVETTVTTGNLSLKSIIMNGKTLSPHAEQIQADGTLEIAYERTFRQTEGKENPDNKGIAGAGLVGPSGIFLTDGWYPSLEGFFYFNLTALVPKGFKAVSTADTVATSQTPDGVVYTFGFPYPLERTTLVAARYEVTQANFNGIKINAYFFPENINLAESYVAQAEKYLRLYGEYLGPYPYKRFSVVEHFLATQYSSPTLTILGPTDELLPFTADTALAHEMLHQWFGNYVYIDKEKGDWSEGLAAYLADHLDNQGEEAWKHRKKLLVDYLSYIKPDNQVPLGELVGKKDFAAMAVGYTKGAMVFHMLKNHVGENIFYKSLSRLIENKSFRRASWQDVIDAFEETSEKELDWFFRQWITGKGVPSFLIQAPRVIMQKGTPVVSFRVRQMGGPYRFSLPVKVVTANKEYTERLAIENENEFFELPVAGRPLELVVDEDYDLMRKITKAECPPVISLLLGDENRIVVLPRDNMTEHEELSEPFKSAGFRTKSENDIKDRDIQTSSLLVLDNDSKLLKRLFGISRLCPEPDSAADVTLFVRKNPLNTAKVLATISGGPQDQIGRIVPKLFRYGKYSHLVFRDGEIVFKDAADSARGIRINLSRPVKGFRPAQTLDLKEIIQNIIATPIIYVGEGHTLYEDHNVQLEVIRSLHEDGRKFAIGMEMFQRPYQKSLDDYITAATTEKEFLKSSEYFKRWGYNYHLYREILEFARKNKIPIVALNQEAEIIKKVSRQGLDALSDEEKSKLPDSMDMSDENYERRLRKVYYRHGRSQSKGFLNFQQAQVLWDETMAQSIDGFLKDNPAYQMVVIAGSGHIAYGSGIPKRVYRLNAKDYVTLLNAKADTPLNGLADYVLFPESLSPPSSPTLGILIQSEDGGVRIDGVTVGGLAGKAGLRKGDLLLSMDDMQIGDTDDVFISLLDKKPGDTLNIKALRKRFLLKDRQMEFSIKFP